MKKTKTAFLITFSFIFAWMIPLFFEPNTLLRYAFEELRVLVTGIVIGYLVTDLLCHPEMVEESSSSTCG